ncbi:hypothetical protein SteCoe_15380 [Stentor coeruleus]|uniref:Uncharacterized protein n=1 Tax=Stentor coeruleus TaxID=5963 RepID=A0A1R2C3Q0_9CILI|nr:hypothetical protein SteCoe_15380 [Stentor coeruleus]
MKRNQSAKTTGFRIAPRVSPNLQAGDSNKAQELRNRLIERGLSSKPLPSVKKPKVSQSSQKLQTVPTFASLPDTKLLLRPSSSRISITGFTSIGALRPSSAVKNLKIPTSLTTRTANHPSRPTTARTNISTLQRIATRTLIDVSDTTRAMNLIDKLTNRPKTARQEAQETPIPKDIIEEIYTDYEYQETKIDEFIRRIREKRIEENEFVYLLRDNESQETDYYVVEAEEARNDPNREFYTLSAKGLSMFVSGSPVEFIRYQDFLSERKQFFSLQNVSFFKRFRAWKTVKMWQRNVNRIRRSHRKKKLEEKLYSVDSQYSKVLLNHRYMCLDMEKMRFIDIPGHLEQMPLNDFLERQYQRIEEVRKYIEDANKTLRTNVRQGVTNIMNQLREEIVMDIAEKKNYGKLNLQMLPPVRRICALYEKMGFPENMSYDQRSDLRKECSRYIRFSYLVDFIALESLQNMYLMSVRELLLKIYEQIVDLEDLNDNKVDKSIIIQAEGKKRNRVPLFKVDLKLNTNTELVGTKIPIVYEFNSRKSSPDDFHPNIHLSFDGENIHIPSFIIKDLEKCWLKLAPTRQYFIESMETLINQGLACLKSLQRWSRHPDIQDFVLALEDWDDKVADKWDIAENLELDILSWIEEAPLYRKIHKKLTSLVYKAFTHSEEKFILFEYPIQSYYKNLEINYNLLEKENLLSKVDSFDWTFSMFKTQRSKVEKAPKFVDSGLFRIDCQEVRNFLILNSRDSLKKSYEILMRIIREKVDFSRQWSSKSVKMLGSKIFTVEDFVGQKLSLSEVNEKIAEVKRTIDLLGHMFNLGLRADIGLTPDDTDSYQITSGLMTTLNGYIINIESTEAKNMVLYKKKLKLMVPDFLQDVQAVNLKIQEEKYLRLESDTDKTIIELKSLLDKCSSFTDYSKSLSRFQEVLGEPLNTFHEVHALQEQVDIRYKMWTGFKEYEKIHKRILYTPLKLLDPYQATLQAEEYHKIVRRSESVINSSTVLDRLKYMVEETLSIMPVISALRAPFLDTHWKMLRDLLGQNFEINENLTLMSLSKYKIKENTEEIQAISIQATQEHELKSQLNAITSIWEEMEIPIQQYKEKDLWILGDIEPLVTNLEESLAKISLIAGNRYVTPLRDEVVTWRNHLNTIQDVLDEWTTLQKTWLYFNAIFASQDIKRRLATETQIYESVDKFYRTFMKKLYLNNNALRVMVLEGKLLDYLKKHNNSLEIVQRNLSQYLEDKRIIFPRFYFISDEELLKVLAQAGNPLSLQPYIAKCFENIYRLEFGEDIKAADVIGMVSSEGESVSFGGRVLKARGNVEEWLGNVQNAMVDTLMKAMKYCKEDSEKAVFKTWVLSVYPAQIIATVGQINWCIETDVVLGSIHDAPNAFPDWITHSAKNLLSLIDLVRSPTTELKRKLIVAMITTSVHNRDILANMLELQVETNSDFAWQKQLRYYWDSDLCIIKQINYSTQYAYEYLGCTSRLVVTPLTEKCWITITSALNVKLGACPSGPAGTGKTESTKDLAKALGQFCIVFNCSEQITFKMTGRLFAGLIQQGAWSCLDEFNRIDIEVLSVIAQQLQTIKHAQVLNVKDFMFEGRKIALKSGFSVFVTMNPGYAGRTELPDNLKVLFRPVAMMIPDYAMIAEIMLMAEGFQEGTRLSKKIVQLYKLASEQLSIQHHYDFGLRALKSVLLTAGDIRRKLEETDEEIMLIQAMNESNLPKLIAKDALLFKALVRDLFPGVIIKPSDNSDLHEKIQKIIETQNYLCPENFEKKIFELNDTVQVRFGSMLLGPAMSGKTTIYTILSKIKGIKVHCLNPKSITIGELYGDMNPLTQDWKDGLASSIFREITNGSNPELNWVVFDGPVDSLWIESMNTVLDDNMMLCLPNGERIKLKPTMRILFEVMDLSKASPATVSRCGMVFIPNESLTWQMLMNTWLKKYESKEHRDALNTLFNSILPPLFRVYDYESDMVPTSEIHKVCSLCKFLSILLEPLPKVKHITAIFAFAVIWTIGAFLDGSKQERFSNTIRHLFSQSSLFPIPDMVYDYYLDKSCAFQSWKDLIPSIVLSKEMSLAQVLIPTPITATYTYLLNKLYSQNVSTLLIGGSGVGKSSLITMHVNDQLAKQEIELVRANFSARTTSEKVQQYIEAKLERKAAGVFTGASNRKLLMFLDDVSMPAKDAYDTQAPIELLRQLMDTEGFYDRKKGFFKKICNFVLNCASGISGLQDLSPRFLRHFHVFYLPEPSHAIMSTIFSAILNNHFDKSFAESVRKSITVIIGGTIEIYEKVVMKLKPTPSKFHYKYNLRDVSKVIQGSTFSTPATIPNVDKLTKLWLHECCRVFYDRLTTSQDRLWFYTNLTSTGFKHFKVNFLQDDWLEAHPLIFSNLYTIDNLNPSYEEIIDKRRIKKLIEDRLEDFNSKNKQKMNLEIFDEALSHILHISRGIFPARGHMMLIGVGGSGKQSLAMLGSFLLSYIIYTIQLIKNYNIDNFHDDLKKMMEISAVNNKNLAFVFSDQHMIHDSFLEDINALINSGEVTDLFTDEEMETIINNLRPDVVDKLKLADTKENIYNEFLNRVKDNLHVILCTSPVGNVLRNRCRMFPALVNCSTLDWFENWPEQALLSVASAKLTDFSSSICKTLSSLASSMHLSSETTSSKFAEEMRRVAYVTPKIFFDFLELFSLLVRKSNTNILGRKKKLSNGLEKLHETRKIIAESQIELQQMIPDLESEKKKAENYYIEVQKETKSAVELQETVEKETEFIEIQAQECKVRADDAEKDLAEAMPILEAAIKAVQALEKNKKDIIEFKKYLKPPEAVKMVMEAVCILLNERSDWTNAISVLGQMDFLQRLINYQRESVTNNIFKKLRAIVSRPEFQPETVAQSSEAARSLCIWCIAMYKFTEAYQLVKPKREKVSAMQIKLKSDMEKLQSKQDELRAVEDKVRLLKDECALTEAKVASLEKKIKITMDRVKRAELLLELLAEEGVKWRETLDKLEDSLKYIEGEAMINAGCICYMGVYSDLYREGLRNMWYDMVKNLNVLISEDYSIINSLGKPIQIRAWQIAGLPKDSLSIENSIIVVNSIKWAMIIDPQEQARRWLKNTEKTNNLITAKASKTGTKEAKDLIRALEAGLSQGKPVLLEDVGESIDSSLQNVICRKFYKKDDGRVMIKLADLEISFDDNFRLFLICKYSNPNFLPDIFGNLNVINFTVTSIGLEDQLLVEVVRLENPKLEKERDDIVVSMAYDQKTLEDLQNSILDMIADSQGYILDNLALIAALQKSKSTSKDITRRVAATAQVEKSVNASRDTFRNIAVRGTVLYFVIASIPGINPMYQYSLAFYTKLYCNAIQNTTETKDRVQVIISNITKTIYNVICRGLFEKDKKLLAFLFAAAIERNANSISTEAWNYFIRGGGLLNKKNPKKNPLQGKLTEIQWDLICKLDKLLPFDGLSDDITFNKPQWSDYIFGNILQSEIPNKYNLIDTFSRILLIKVFRPEKVMYTIDEYAKKILGSYFAQAPISNIEELFDESDKKTPIVFILSQGTDPVENIMKITKERGMGDKFLTISLGQGQGNKAQDAFEKSKSGGFWLLLQNCHLSKSWLPTLETLIDNLQDDTGGHRDFRVILTSMPSSYFPVSILQNSLKITTEAPSGLKSNLMRVYSEVASGGFGDMARPEVWKKMVFAVSFFHALVMERRKYGPLGFNIRYEFNESDFYTSIKLMKLLVEENEDIPWEGIQYIIGNINYGGRVTDNNDRVCLMATFNKCCNSDMLEENYNYTENEVYKIPNTQDYLEYIGNLPNNDPPEIFGLNINAQITLETQTSESIIQCLIQTQPKAISSEASNSDKTIHAMCKSISISLPETMDFKAAHSDLLVQDQNGLIPSLSTFLFQEIEKFNKLLETMRKTLKELRNAIKGKNIMTDDLFSMYNCLLCSTVPDIWAKVAYPSLKPLASWITDLAARVKFIFDWLKYGNQNCFWLSGFFFPQSFLTAVLQTHSRKYSLPIDCLVFTFEVTPFMFSEFKKTVNDGVFIYGLYLEGARWDSEEMILIDAQEKEIYFTMPVIQFLPTHNYVAKEGDYLCPVYKTGKRAGILSSTGLSTNFVVYVDLPSEEIPDKWTLLGTALLCQINI